MRCLAFSPLLCANESAAKQRVAEQAKIVAARRDVDMQGLQWGRESNANRCRNLAHKSHKSTFPLPHFPKKGAMLRTQTASGTGNASRFHRADFRSPACVPRRCGCRRGSAQMAPEIGTAIAHHRAMTARWSDRSSSTTRLERARGTGKSHRSSAESTRSPRASGLR